MTAWRRRALTGGALALALVLGRALAMGQAPSVGPRPNVGPADRPVVDPVAVERGARVWSAECVTCHGASARGSEKVPSLLRSLLILRDRRGSELGPFLQRGHPTQSGRASAIFTDAEVADLMQFVRQRINDTLRGSPVFVPGNIVTGSASAGAAHFGGAGGCAACHSATGDLAGLSGRYPDPVDLQQRMLFPLARSTGRGGAPSRTAVTATVRTPDGRSESGVVIDHDDFFVTIRLASGVLRTIRKTPATSMVITDPLDWHHGWLDRVTDREIHDLVAYLVTLK